MDPDVFDFNIDRKDIAQKYGLPDTRNYGFSGLVVLKNPVTETENITLQVKSAGDVLAKTTRVFGDIAKPGNLPKELLPENRHSETTKNGKAAKPVVEPLIRRSSRQPEKRAVAEGSPLETRLIAEKKGEIVELEGLVVSLGEENAFQADRLEQLERKNSRLSAVLGMVLASADYKDAAAFSGNSIELSQVDERIGISGILKSEAGHAFDHVFAVGSDGSISEVDYVTETGDPEQVAEPGQISFCLPVDFSALEKLVGLSLDGQGAQMLVGQMTGKDTVK